MQLPHPTDRCQSPSALSILIETHHNLYHSPEQELFQVEWSHFAPLVWEPERGSIYQMIDPYEAQTSRCSTISDSPSQTRQNLLHSPSYLPIPDCNHSFLVIFAIFQCRFSPFCLRDKVHQEASPAEMLRIPQVPTDLARYQVIPGMVVLPLSLRLEISEWKALLQVSPDSPSFVPIVLGWMDSKHREMCSHKWNRIYHQVLHWDQKNFPF